MNYLKTLGFHNLFIKMENKDDLFSFLVKSYCKKKIFLK